MDDYELSTHTYKCMLALLKLVASVLNEINRTQMQRRDVDAKPPYLRKAHFENKAEVSISFIRWGL